MNGCRYGTFPDADARAYVIAFRFPPTIQLPGSSAPICQGANPERRRTIHLALVATHAFDAVGVDDPAHASGSRTRKCVIGFEDGDDGDPCGMMSTVREDTGRVRYFVRNFES